MQVEQLEILDFLRAHPPFDALPEEVLQRVAAAVDVRYYKAGETIVARTGKRRVGEEGRFRGAADH